MPITFSSLRHRPRYAMRGAAPARAVALCAFFMVMALLPSQATAATLTLMWDPNTEPGVVGYKVFYGTTPRQYDTSLDTGSQTWTQLTVSDTPAATYYFAVQAYTGTGLYSPLSAEISWSTGVDVPPSAVRLTSLTSDKTAPQPTGTSITFGATASGGVSPLQYKWWISADGANWTPAQDWSTAASYVWTPTIAGSNYRVRVWARSATSTADTFDNPSAAGEMPFAISASPLAVAVAAVKAGQRTVFTATVSGTDTFHYKWWLYDGIAWTVQQNWSTSNKFTWKTSAAGANYLVRVWVRRATSVADQPEGTAERPFPSSQKR